MFRIALFAVFLFACGSKSEDKGGGSGSAGSGSAGSAGSGSAMAAADAAVDAMEVDAAPPDAAAPAFDFTKLKHDEQVAFMKKEVLPKMKTEFQGFDAKKYKGFNCKTCHGKNADKNKFKMPNPDIPKLDFAKLKAGKQNPKMAKFMKDSVEPDMAKILQVEPYDEKTNPNGFGCLACHETVGGKTAPAKKGK